MNRDVYDRFNDDNGQAGFSDPVEELENAERESRDFELLLQTLMRETNCYRVEATHPSGWTVVYEIFDPKTTEHISRLRRLPPKAKTD